jgi:hypothetical protein
MQNLTVNKDLKLPIKIKRQRISKENLLSKNSSNDVFVINKENN